MTRWNTVAIVGVGLIGGSLGLELLRRGLAQRVVGIGRRDSSLRAARKRGCVTNTTLHLDRGVRAADLVVVCTPVERVVDDVRRAAAACRPGTLITDVGSTKQSIVAAVDGNLPPHARFVGSHPLAGSEQSGPSAAIDGLFDGRVVVVTPTSRTAPDDLRAVTQLWTDLGARVECLSPAEHDRALAAMSHAPHAVAYALARATPEEYVHLAGGGWTDTTRIAASDPALWRQILLDNRRNVLTALTRFSNSLATIRAALKAGDSAALEQALADGCRKRRLSGNPHALGS